MVLYSLLHKRVGFTVIKESFGIYDWKEIKLSTVSGFSCLYL